MRYSASLFTLALALICSVSFSQQIYNKDGKPVLPEKGDWGLGIDVNRMVNFASLKLAPASQLISAKYMIDSSEALRLGARVAYDNHVVRNRTVDRAAAAGSVQAYPAAQQLKDNVWYKASWMLGFSAGKEKRKGGRLQGLYGWEGMVVLSETMERFTYGNKLNASQLGRITVDESGDAMSSPELGNANNIDTVPLIQGVTGSARVLQRRSGLTVAVAFRFFAGAEYFVLPKMSLGAELGWGIGFSGTSRSVTVLESEGTSSVPGSTGAANRETTVDGNSKSRFSLGHDAFNPGSGLSAGVRVHLYF